MLTFKLAWRNLIRHSRKSLLLGSLIASGMALLFLANSIFEGTNSGLRKTFVGSFTGDAVISVDSGSSYSLFGNEVPIVSEYETIPPLYSHNQLESLLHDSQLIHSKTSIVSVPSKMNLNGYKVNVPLFGVDPSSYFDVCPDIKIKSGNVNGLSESGVYLNSVLAAKAESALGRPLVIGEPISFSMYIGNTFRIRTIPLLGIHEYSGTTEALDRVVLADLTTVRSLANYTLGFTSSDSEPENEDIVEDSFNMDDLFAVDSDVLDGTGEEISLESIEVTLSETGERDSLVLTDNGAWSFMLIRAVNGKSAQLQKMLKSLLKQNDLGAELLSWRRAAGSTALIIFAIQTLFNIGLGVLAFGAVLVIMNALVFSVLERSKEIGTMRSIGASPGFIRSLFMMESMIITIGGAVIGIIIATILVFILRNNEFHLSNPLLISLFGGSIVQPYVTLSSFFIHIGIAILLGILSWIYPVSLAMKVQPISAINKV